jgi:hypothetical protein
MQMGQCVKLVRIAGSLNLLYDRWHMLLLLFIICYFIPSYTMHVHIYLVPLHIDSVYEPCVYNYHSVYLLHVLMSYFSISVLCIVEKSP